MGNLFHPEGKFARYCGKLWDMMWLNILVCVCSLPIITAGAAITAMHYIMLKIFRDEEGAITASFLKVFKSNFKQSTIISLIFALVIYLLIVSIGIAFASQMRMLLYFLIAVLAVVICVLNWALIFQSRYRNSITGTIKYGVMAVIAHPLRSVLLAVLAVIPIAALWVAFENFILVLLCGFTLPGFVEVFLYNGVFKKLETADNDDKSDMTHENGGRNHET